MARRNPLFNVSWTMKTKKSKFRPSTNTPDKESRLYEPVRGGYKLTVTGTRNGAAYSWGYTALYDGKDHPVHGRKDVDSIVAYKVNSQVTIGSFKKKGVPIAEYKRTIDLNEELLTVVASGVNENGEPYFDVIQYNIS